MRDNIKKILYIILLIWTVVALFIVYKKIEFPFVIQFIISYVIYLLLAVLYFIISILLNMRKLRWSIIRKMLLKFIIIAFVFWAFNLLFTYLTKGELILNDKILLPITTSFGLTFGELLFFKKNEY